MRIEVMFVGLVVLALGIALVAGAMTQTTTTDPKTKQVITTPGVLPFVLPDTFAGFPMIAIAGIVALLGAAITIVGFNIW